MLIPLITECLTSYLPRNWMGCKQKPCLYGRVETSLRCNGESIWLYRFFVALPNSVVWNRLQEKLLKKNRAATRIPLGQEGYVRDWIDVSFWDGESLNSFVDFWRRCRAAILIDSHGVEQGEGRFGDERAVVQQCCRVHKGLIGRI